MWMAEKLVSSEGERSLCGPVEIGAGQSLYLHDGRPVPLSGVLAPYGYFALPAVGSDGRAAPDGAGGYLLCGVTAAADGLEPGEIRIVSAGGGYILLKNTGEVVINGLVIDSEGRIVTE